MSLCEKQLEKCLLFFKLCETWILVTYLFLDKCITPLIKKNHSFVTNTKIVDENSIVYSNCN